MQGTVLCAVMDDSANDDVLALGVELSERLSLRLVLAHPVDGIPAAEDSQSVTTKFGRQGAERRLAELARKHGIADRSARRVAVGSPAILLGQIAAEEGADVIVIPGRARGWRGHLDTRLAAELEGETPVPVLIAPPRRSKKAALGSAQRESGRRTGPREQLRPAATRRS
jgi:nucleotide-binding universal stress UspA family protein